MQEFRYNLRVYNIIDRNLLNSNELMFLMFLAKSGNKLARGSVVVTVKTTNNYNDMETKNIMKYSVSQTFATLGDPCKSSHATIAEAASVASTLRGEIATMVATRQIPVDLDPCPLGNIEEIVAWIGAAQIAGVRYGLDNKITCDSPTHYGAEAGRYIAGVAVRCTRIKKLVVIQTHTRCKPSIL